MQNWGQFLLVIGVANLPAVMQQWRADRPGFIKTLWLTLYVALGLALIQFLLPGRDGTAAKAWLLAGVVVGWILYGALTLMRVVPRYREPPRWLMRFGIADLVLLGPMFGCLGAYLCLRMFANCS